MQLVHETRPAIPRDRLMRLPEVEKTTGMKKSTIYKMVSEGLFSQPVRISRRMVAWPESVCLQWVQDRIKEASLNTDKAINASHIEASPSPIGTYASRTGAAS